MESLKLWTLHRVVKERCGIPTKGDTYLRIPNSVLDSLAHMYPQSYLRILEEYKEALKNQYAVELLGDGRFRLACLSAYGYGLRFYMFECVFCDGEALIASLPYVEHMSDSMGWVDCKQEYRRLGKCN